MRRSATPAIPPSLYRHFAVLTVVAAAGLAMFADGDNREAQAAQVAQAQHVARPAQPVIARAAPTAATGSSSGGWDEADFDGTFGAPMETPVGDSRVATDIGEDSPPAPATLSSVEREVLLRGLREHVTPTPGG